MPLLVPLSISTRNRFINSKWFSLYIKCRWSVAQNFLIKPFIYPTGLNVRQKAQCPQFPLQSNIRKNQVLCSLYVYRLINWECICIIVACILFFTFVSGFILLQPLLICIRIRRYHFTNTRQKQTATYHKYWRQKYPSNKRLWPSGNMKLSSP